MFMGSLQKPTHQAARESRLTRHILRVAQGIKFSSVKSRLRAGA